MIFEIVRSINKDPSHVVMSDSIVPKWWEGMRELENDIECEIS